MAVESRLGRVRESGGILLNDNIYFVLRWLRNPLKIGAILPSGKELSAALASAVPRDGNGIVIELGAGTGAVTQALLSSGLLPDEIVVIERDRDMYRRLRKRFPDLSVCRADAHRIGEIPEIRSRGAVRAIVSSLPLLAISPAERDEIFKAAADVLAENGVIIQFTYGLGPPIDSAQWLNLDFAAEPVARVWLNLPSATVWVFRRRQSGHSDQAPQDLAGGPAHVQKTGSLPGAPPA